jgi:hypothetical protein
MDRLANYLVVPANYSTSLRDLRWSSSGDALEFGDGSTFAFRAEVFRFLEGFAAQRPLIHFGHIIHLMYILREPGTPFLGRSDDLLPRAFTLAGRPQRNAGAFCAVLCANIPSLPDPPLVVSMESFQLEVGASEPLDVSTSGAAATLSPVLFEVRLLQALSAYDFEEILHWLRHGRGPVAEAGAAIAQAVLLDKPRTLTGVLADLAQRRRLAGAVPFVEQLVSALTLPPRRLEQSELPLGGYSDVATRGPVEQLLPSQLAFDDLEFVRRHAERELLYFHREEPHVHTREDLVVLLDQGVRAWGSVRLVLTAALFALGRLAERRRVPFRVSATSAGGELLDPLEAPATSLDELIEASDLSAHPGASLERVLADDTGQERDIVLLTHPRSLTESEVVSAARQLRPGARLFAVAVDEHGSVQLSAIQGGLPVCRSRFHVDLQRTAPPPAQRAADPLEPWRGDVEPIGYPFRFGAIASQRPGRFAFDAAGEWLLTATIGGMLHATRTDGSRFEILPRGFVDGAIVATVDHVLGVAGGFVVTREQSNQILALHYDFHSRTCTAHRFERASPSHPPRCFYLRKLHTICVSVPPKTSCLHLSTGSRETPPAAHAHLDHRVWSTFLPIQGEGEPRDPERHWSWPQATLDSASGTVTLANVVPAWESFTPLADNQPVLAGCRLQAADCQGHTLAATVSKPGHPVMLRLFRGPHGIPLASFPQSTHRFALSSDGRLLAREMGRGRVEIRDVLVWKVPLHITRVGCFHPVVQVELGERWLMIQIDKAIHLVRWDRGRLAVWSGRTSVAAIRHTLMAAGLANGGVPARSGRLPAFLPPDAGERFCWTAWSNLIAVVDRFGEVALFEQSGELVCLFFAFRQQLAVWMPDGTCHGPASLLVHPATPDALDRIGLALHTAWARGERTTLE